MNMRHPEAADATIGRTSVAYFVIDRILTMSTRGKTGARCEPCVGFFVRQYVAENARECNIEFLQHLDEFDQCRVA